MLDLINGYLILVILLFSTNLGLFYGNKRNIIPLKFCMISLVLFVMIVISRFFNFILTDFFNYIFIAVSVIEFIIFYYYLSDNNRLLSSIFFTLILFYVTVFLLSCQITEFSYINGLLYAIFSLIIMFVSYQFSKLLIHAKREYPVIIGEYMVLSSLLIFILGLTYWATKQLDYSMFSPFLILTPTYQLIYIIIAVAVILIIGSYLNDKMR